MSDSIKMSHILTVYRCLCLTIIALLLINFIRDFYAYIILFVAVHVSYKLFLEKRYKQLLPVNKKSVLISGCDTGFGQQLANRLADHGFIVFAGVLHINGEGADKLRRRRLSNLHILQLDVSNAEDAEKAFKIVNDKTKNNGLWAVVNNAGINFRGDVELCLMEYYRKCHDVNLYGAIRLVKTFLPHIRKSKGRIVNVSSARGRYSLPGDTVYQTSKFGLESFTDILRLEMMKFDVGVSVVEPARYDAATSCSSPAMCERLRRLCDEMWENATSEVKETYGKEYCYKQYVAMKRSVAGTSTTPDPVLDAIEDALLNMRPKERYLVDSATGFIDKSATLARILPLVPEFISDPFLKWYTGCCSFLPKQT